MRKSLKIHNLFNSYASLLSKKPTQPFTENRRTVAAFFISIAWRQKFGGVFGREKSFFRKDGEDDRCSNLGIELHQSKTEKILKSICHRNTVRAAT